MARVFESRTVRHTALAFGLCLLGFSFAMESKLALYSVAGGSETEIPASKARLTDLPEVEASDVPAPDPVHPKILFVFFEARTFASLWTADGLLRRVIVHNYLSDSSTSCFSPNLFIRPPPVR